MMPRSRYFWALLGVVAVLQVGVLGKMVADRIALLKSGREVILPVHPVDPRDFLRGDYVVLGYDVSILEAGEAELGQPVSSFERGDPVYVIWKKVNQGWSLKSLSSLRPEGASSDEVVVKARIGSVWPVAANDNRRRFMLRYGIESYFVPEGQGHPLEEAVRQNKMEAIVAVGADGTAALKGLVIGGERREDPPLL
jgi:uncharacterized membrane-anchored protein